MDTKAEGLAKEPGLCVMFNMDALIDGCVVAHGQNLDFMLCLL